jgi:hypothetical protein
MDILETYQVSIHHTLHNTLSTFTKELLLRIRIVCTIYIFTKNYYFNIALPKKGCNVEKLSSYRTDFFMVYSNFFIVFSTMQFSLDRMKVLPFLAKISKRRAHKKIVIPSKLIALVKYRYLFCIKKIGMETIATPP